MIIVSVEAVFGEVSIDSDGIHEVIRIMGEETRKESGCLKYVFSVDINDSTIVRIFEQWESYEALETHFKSAHMAAFQKSLAGIEMKSMDVKAYEVNKEVPLPTQ
jgi:quinol monooxygenase YgiN